MCGQPWGQEQVADRAKEKNPGRELEFYHGSSHAKVLRQECPWQKLAAGVG